MNFLVNPNLPEKNVKYALCDSRVEETIVNELIKLGCSPVMVPYDESLSEPVSSHPDMHFFHYEQFFYVSRTFNKTFSHFNNYIKDSIDCEKINKVVIDKNLEKEYPYDVLLNSVAIGDYILCNDKTVCKEILLTDAEKIFVKQGYTKCSVAVVDKNAIITDDCGIYNKVKNIIDALLVRRGEVMLNGYNYGFIGGSCGKISKNLLAFCGDIKNLRDYNNIINFCRNYNVECVSLSKSSLYDYGSIIPIIEE